MLETLSPAAPTAEPQARPDRPRHTLLAHALEGLEARFLADRLARGAAHTILHVARDQPRMAFLASAARLFAPEGGIVPSPAWDSGPDDRTSPNTQTMPGRRPPRGRLAAGRGD